MAVAFACNVPFGPNETIVLERNDPPFILAAISEYVHSFRAVVACIVYVELELHVERLQAIVGVLLCFVRTVIRILFVNFLGQQRC